jgi:ATP-dependent Clp protease ATP-binding subunit ClpC
VFERFTERARQAVVLAQDEARGLGHNYIGTEHLLLGLLREEEGIAARVLEARKVDLDVVRAEVSRIVGIGEALETGQVSFTPRAKRVLELSLKEALALGHDWIGTEHVLLGLAREKEGVAALILADLGAPPRVLAEDVLTMLGGGPASTGYAEAFAAEVSPSAAPDRPFFTLRPVRRTVREVLIVGWVLVGLAFGLGLLVGWLIWA